MEGPGDLGPRRLRRDPRCHDRQHRAALHRTRPPRLDRDPVVGRQRVHPRLRRTPAARRSSGGPVRPAADVHRRAGDLRFRVPGRGPVDVHESLIGFRALQGVGAAALAPAARALVTHAVRRGFRAQQGARHLGGGRGLGHRRRAHPRRRADQRAGLAVGPVRQRPRRRDCGRARAAPDRRVARRDHGPLDRHPRRRPGQRRPGRGALRRHQSERSRLGLDPDRRAARGRRCHARRLRRRRVARARRSCRWRCSGSARSAAPTSR